MIAIIQARMSSQRLPEKVLKDLNGTTVLGRTVNQIKRSKLIKDIIVATSTDSLDDQISSYCFSNGINIYRGDLLDVFSRFKRVILKTKCKEFVRISADSPLIDPSLINKAIKIYHSGEYDIVTNTFSRTYPKGQSVEVVNSKVFIELDKNKLSVDEKEHVTKRFYNYKENYKIKNFKSRKNYSSFQMSIDTYEDFKNINFLLKKVNNKTHDWERLLKIMIDNCYE